MFVGLVAFLGLFWRIHIRDMDLLRDQINGIKSDLNSNIGQIDANLNKNIDKIDVGLNRNIEKLDENLNRNIEKIDVALSEKMVGLGSKIDRLTENHLALSNSFYQLRGEAWSRMTGTQPPEHQAEQ